MRLWQNLPLIYSLDGSPHFNYCKDENEQTNGETRLFLDQACHLAIERKSLLKTTLLLDDFFDITKLSSLSMLFDELRYSHCKRTCISIGHLFLIRVSARE